MQTWVVCDCDEKSLEAAEFLAQSPACAQPTRCLKPADIAQWSASPGLDADVVLFLAPTLGQVELELIHQLRSGTDGVIVVVSSAFDQATLLKVIRSGASDILDLNGDLKTELLACLSRLHQDRDRHDRRARTVSIVPCHVSTDASILASNVAAVIAKRFGNCCLLDFQLRGGDLALLLKLHPEHSLFDLVSRSQSIDATMFQQALAAHETGIQLLAGPELFSDLRGIDATACNSVVDLARTCFPHVVVATEDIQHSEQIYTLLNSDHVILTMRADVLSLHHAKLHLDFIAAQDIPLSRVHIAVFIGGSPGELPYSAISKVFADSKVHFIPVNTGEVTVSINVGSPIVVESPRSKMALAITELTEELTGVSAAQPTKTSGYISAARTAAALAVSALQLGK